MVVDCERPFCVSHKSLYLLLIDLWTNDTHTHTHDISHKEFYCKWRWYRPKTLPAKTYFICTLYWDEKKSSILYFGYIMGTHHKMLKSLYIQDAVKQGQWQVTPESKASHTHPHYHHKSNITFQQTYQADQDEERNQANEDHHHCWQKVEKCTEVHVTGRCKCGNDSSNSRKNPCKSLQMCVCVRVCTRG